MQIFYFNGHGLQQCWYVGDELKIKGDNALDPHGTMSLLAVYIDYTLEFHRELQHYVMYKI